MEIERSGKKRRLHIVLSLDNPRQREAWEILAREKNKTSAVCEAVCGFHEEKKLEDTLRKILREELKHIPAQKTAEASEAPNLSNDTAVLDFLQTLQNE